MREFLRRLTLRIGRKYTIEENWKESKHAPNKKLDLILEFLMTKDNQAFLREKYLRNNIQHSINATTSRLHI